MDLHRPAPARPLAGRLRRGQSPDRAVEAASKLDNFKLVGHTINSGLWTVKAKGLGNF